MQQYSQASHTGTVWWFIIHPALVAAFIHLYQVWRKERWTVKLTLKRWDRTVQRQCVWLCVWVHVCMRGNHACPAEFLWWHGKWWCNSIQSRSFFTHSLSPTRCFSHIHEFALRPPWVSVLQSCKCVGYSGSLWALWLNTHSQTCLWSQHPLSICIGCTDHFVLRRIRDHWLSKSVLAIHQPTNLFVVSLLIFKDIIFIHPLSVNLYLYPVLIPVSTKITVDFADDSLLGLKHKF